MLIRMLIAAFIVCYFTIGIGLSFILWEKETIFTSLFWPIVVIWLVVKAILTGADTLAEKLKEFVEDLRD